MTTLTQLFMLALLALPAREVMAGSSACLEVIVSNEGSGDLAVVDPAAARVVAKIPVGGRPRGMALSPDREHLYVAINGPPAGIGVVDLTQRKLVRVIGRVSDPERIAISRDGRRLFVASGDRGTVVMLETDGGEVLARTPVGAEARGVDISPGGVRVYATSVAENKVTMLDTKSATRLSTIKVGRQPRATAFSPDGLRAYVANEASGNISVIDTSTLRRLRNMALPKGAQPTRIVVPPEGSPLYVSTGQGREILAIDARSGELLKRAESGAQPSDLAISPGGIELYVADLTSSELGVFELPELKLRARIPTGEKPRGVVCRDQWWLHEGIGTPGPS